MTYMGHFNYFLEAGHLLKKSNILERGMRGKK